MDTAIQTEIDQNYKYNFTVNLLDGAFFNFGASFIALRTIGPLFLSYLTDNTLVFGLLSVMVSTGWLLPQLFTANWVQNLPVKKVVPVRIGFFTQRLPLILLPLAAWLAFKSYSLAMVAFLVLCGWYLYGAGTIAVGWQDMIAKIFRVERRGRFFGTTQFTGTATGIFSAAAAAWLLDRYAFPTNFIISFAVGGVFIFLSWASLAMTKEPALPPATEKLSRKNYWKKLPEIIKNDKNFRRYLYSQFSLSLGTMGVGFFTIYAVQTWEIPDSMVGFFTTSMLVGQAGSNLLFGWLADKYGHKLVLEITSLAMVLTAGIALFAPAAEYFYLVFALQGVSLAGLLISGTMIVFEFCEPEVRPTYIGLTNTATGVFSGLAPLVGLFLIDFRGYAWLFGAALVFSLVGWGLLRFTVKEPRGKVLVG